MSNPVQETSIKNEMSCKNCGALLTFKPGTLKLTCQYCLAENEIAQAAAEIVENDLEAFLAKHNEREEKVVITTIKCETCGASSTVNPKITSDKCPFCATTYVLKNGSSSSFYKPQYLLPFGIDDKQAMANFKKWLKSLWFAPAALVHYADRADRLNGMYLPFWTFDCSTESSYTGQRGIDKTTTVRTTNDKGQSESDTVTETTWYPASGRVSNEFDDLLIEASTSLPTKLLRSLEPWDVKSLVAYNDQYLSGFRTETYQLDLPTAYQQGKGRMDEQITRTIYKDIGGDQQRIDSVNTTYKNPKFKYILLPVWISAYQYNSKVYQFVINARTGEVQGQRPYSAFKIIMAVVAALLVWLVLYLIAR